MRPTLAQLAGDLAAGRTTSLELVEDCVARIQADDGEGARAFLHVDADGAREAARAMDALRRVHAEPSPYAGIPVSVKDLFDVRGQVTRAGSSVLGGPPATVDAPAVARWRSAGLVSIGRTNMTEFAFSGLGMNPHYGTPANPWDRSRRRIPGGSSSGAAVSVSDAMAHGALGTDTGGSCRIPAALCGLVGFKPTQSRVPLDGMVPLSATLDSVGVLARTVGCCAILDALLTGGEHQAPSPLSHAPRLAAVRNYVLAGADDQVTAAFERTLEELRHAGAEVIDVTLPELDEIPAMNAGGGFSAAESFAWHRDRIAKHRDGYDPRVLSRILRGEHQSAADLIELGRRRAELIDSLTGRLDGFDAYVCPTVPLVAPPIDELDDDEAYTRVNLLMLRNPTVVNVLDGCAISIPMHRAGEPPMGLMVSGMSNADTHVFRTATWIEEKL